MVSFNRLTEGSGRGALPSESDASERKCGVMMRDRKLAGIGAIIFGGLFIPGMIFGNVPGGDYDAGDVADFVASGHRTNVYISIALMALAVVGLLLVTAYLSGTYFGEGVSGRIAWGTGLLAAAALIIGLGVAYTPAMSLAVGGGPSIDPEVSYTIMQAGLGVMFFVGGIMLGVSLLALAIGGHAAPTWVRAVSGLVGLLALFSIMFFPFFAVLLWGLIIGIWLLASTPPTKTPAAQAA